MQPDRTCDWREDHADLRESARRIRARLDGAPCACGRGRDCDCLESEWAAFERRLESHFVLEEADWSGLDPSRMDAITAEWIRRLEREHEGFRRDLMEIRRARHSGPSTSALPEDQRARIRLLLRALLEHELCEWRLSQRRLFEQSPSSSGAVPEANPLGGRS